MIFNNISTPIVGFPKIQAVYSLKTAANDDTTEIFLINSINQKLTIYLNNLRYLYE